MKKLISTFIALLLIGCSSTPSTQIAAFGDSTKAITEKVDEVIKEYNTESLNRQYTDYASTYVGAHATLLTREELAKISVPITPALKKDFAIYRANSALGNYAKSISELATATSQSDIDLAAANFYGSITSLNDQYDELKGKKLFKEESWAKASTLIAAIGSAIVEEKRRKAIKEIVLDADSKIALVCDEIVAGLRVAGFEDSIATSRNYVLTEEVMDYVSRVKDIPKLEDRRQEIKRLHELQKSYSNSKLLVQQSIRAIEQVKQSHSLLAKELQKDRFTSSEISKTVGRLKKLEKHYKNFEELLLSCPKITKNDKGIVSCETE